MWGLLAGLLWVGSFITFPGFANGFWMPKDVTWLLGSFLLASSPWWNPPSRPGLRLPALGWLFCWVLASFAWYVLWPQLTIPQAEAGTQRAIGMRWYVSPILPTLTYLGSFLALDAMVRHTDALIRWQRIALHLVRIGSVVSLVVMGQHVNLDPLDLILHVASYDYRKTAFLGNPTVTGNFLAILAPLCLMFSAKRYRIGSFLLMLLAILVSGSVSSVGAVWVASTSVWIFQRRWKWVIGSVLLVMLGGGWAWWLTSPEWRAGYFNPTGRWEMWTTAWTFWASHPTQAWIGYGAGSVGAATANGIWDYGFLHNDYLEWGFSFGIIGFTLASLVVAQCVLSLRRMVWTGASTAWMGAAVAYGLLMLSGFPMQIGTTLMLGVVIVAAVLSHCQPGGIYAQS